MKNALVGAAKGIGGLFWKPEENEEDLTEVSTPTQPSTKPPAFTSSPAPTSNSEVVSSCGKEDAQTKAILLDALTKANKPGYDYFEFAMAIDEQAKFIPAEETRFQATYATVRSMGISQASLVGDAGFYLDVLKKEEQKFLTSMDGLTQQNVTSKEAQLASIDQKTAEKAEQIKKLTEEINESQKSRTQLINDISQNKSKVEQLKNNFSATLKVVVDRIIGDIEKIKKYIPA